MSLGIIAQLLVGTLQYTIMYALVAIGIALVFGIMKVLNFAHGEMFMLGGFVSYFFFGAFALDVLGLNPYLAFVLTMVIAIVLVGGFAFLLEKLAFRPFRGDLLGALIVGAGLSILIQMSLAFAFGADPKHVPSVFAGAIAVGGVSLAKQSIAMIAVGIAILAAFSVLIRFTKIGLGLRAAAQDKDAAVLQGLNYGAVSSIGFAAGAALAAVAGVLVAPTAYVGPFVGSNYLLNAFIITVVGGLGSIPGCVLAAAIMGLIGSFGYFFLGGTATNLLGFVLIVVVLVVRPQGLLGHSER